MSHIHSPILIAGLPRSGTTWVGETLSSAIDTNYLFEPDNEKLSPLAWFYKREIHRFPYLTANDESDAYLQLWNVILNDSAEKWRINNLLSLYLKQKYRNVEAFIGKKCGYVYIDENMHRVGKEQRRLFEKKAALEFLLQNLIKIKSIPSQKRRLIVKSVHSVLSLDWIADNFSTNVLLILRNPYSLYASYKRMKMPDRFRNLIFQEYLQRDYGKFISTIGYFRMKEANESVAFQIALMYKILEKQISSHPAWEIISHDRLCIEPVQGYRRVFEKQNLSWADAESKISSLNAHGTKFAPKRISDQEPFKWKAEITEEEKSMIDKQTELFELKNFYQTYISL